MSKRAPYYQTDNVTESFDIKDKEGQIIPVSAGFVVVDEADNIYFEGMATIEGNQVSAKIPRHATKDAGVYTIIYTIHLPNGAIRSHKQTYRILPKGYVVSKEFDDAFAVTPRSTPNEILSVKGNAIRALRQFGKSAQEVAEAVSALVEKTTGRRQGL